MKVSILFLAVLAVATTGTNAFLLSILGGIVTEAQIALRASRLVAAVNNFTTLALKTGADGVSLVSPADRTIINTTLLTLPGGQKLDVGALTLPLNLLCQQEALLGAVTCHVCSNDCTFVHNKYGGACGMVDPATAMAGTPQTSGRVCICNDRPPTDGSSFSNSSATCETIIEPSVDTLIISEIQVALRARMTGAQCTPVDPTNPVLFANSAGCNSDCTTNHNYKNGTCEFNTEDELSATYSGEILPGTNCNCYYDNNRSLYPPTTSTA